MKTSAFLFATLFSISAFSNEYWEKPAISNKGMMPVESKTIEDMPPVLSQDTVGLCYGFASATILNYWNCRFFKSKNPNYKCSEMSEKDRFSPIGVSRYSGELPGIPDRDSSFKELHEGGSIYQVLRVMTEEMFEAGSEECASLDKFLTKSGGSSGDLSKQASIWQQLRLIYNQIYKVKKDCPTCLAKEYARAESKIRNEVSPQAEDKDNNRVLQSLAKDTYAESLATLMYPEKCGEKPHLVILQPTLELKVFPEKELSGKKFDQMMKVVADKLNKDIPLTLSFCAALEPTKKCTQKVSGKDGKVQELERGHGVVITGYRKSCKKSKPAECSYSIKVQNSYGKRWQDQFDGGWLDAKVLLDNSFYAVGSLTWVEERE